MHRLSARARRVLEISSVATAAGLLALISAMPANAAPGGGFPARGYTPSATRPNFVTAAGVRTPVRAAATSSVNIINGGPAGFSFSPGSDPVKQGDTVTWTNQSAAPHSVTSDSGVFDSSPSCPGTISNCIQVGGTYSFTFSTPGTYAYHCKVHPTMTGTISVSASGGTTTTSTTSTTVAGGTSTTLAGTTTTVASGVSGSTTQTTAALATTGSQASGLLAIALLTTLAGVVAVAAAGRRRVED